MKRSIAIFRGMLPKVSPRALPDGYAQIANSPRLLSGDLQAWSERAQVGTLAKPRPINTIHLLAQRTYSATRYWLQWTQAELADGESNVDVALGPIPGDTEVATVFTGTRLGPRYTNLDLATNPAYRGSAPVGAYPYSSEPLGIAAPTSVPTVAQTIPPVMPGMESFSYDGSDISEWDEPSRDEGANVFRRWDIDPTIGFPAPSFKGSVRRNAGALLQREFRLDESVAFDISFDFLLDSNGDPGGLRILFLSDGIVGPNIYVDRNGPVSFNEGTGSVQNYSNAGILRDRHYVLKIVGMLREDGYYGITATFTYNGVQAFQLTGRAQPEAGSFGFSPISDANNSVVRILYIDNIVGNILRPPPAQHLPIYTNYVYTLVNTRGWESAPSPPSTTVSVDNGITNVLSIPRPGAGIAKIRIYRTSNSTTAAAYLLVGEITDPNNASLYPFVVTYSDTKTSDQIGPDALVTDGFDPPPANLRGVRALPGGALVGFAGNQICFSDPEYFYAWPNKYRLPTDFPIVGIELTGSTVVVLTQAFPYIAAGNDPGDYAMAKLELPQACVSKRGATYIAGAGVMYPSPDGLYAISGNSAPVNTTSRMFKQAEWRALNPETMIGVANDDRYFGFYRRNDGTQGGIVIDFDTDGFGLIDIPDHATAVYGDSIEDTLYFVADDAYPLPVQTGVALLAWDRGQTLRPYTWRSAVFLEPYPTAHLTAQVKAEDYANLTFRLYGDGVLLYERPVLSDEEFVLPPFPAHRHEIELTGTSRVQQVEIAEDVQELT